MNNQKVTKLSAKDQEIATLKKGNNYLLERVKQQASEIFILGKSLKENEELLKMRDKNFTDLNIETDKLQFELTKIKSNWLFKILFK